MDKANSSFEEKRLKALKNYFILDTPRDLELDEITKIASLVSNMPISLISLVDEDRQWFKSRIGIEIQQTPREISFCTHTINNDEVFIVENALEDERFKRNPLVLNDPNIRFYAGFPLKSYSGFNIGTLCVLDKKKRKLEKKQIVILKSLAKQIINYFELYKNIIELNKIKKSLIQSEKMSSIGRLSSGMSHEINNPLTIIVSKSQFLVEKINCNEVIKMDDLKKEMNSICKAGLKIGEIIKALRQFSQCSDSEEFRVVLFHEILNNTLILCEKIIKDKGIKLFIDDIQNIKIKCKPINLSHAIYNLLLNSYDSVCNLEDKWIKVEIKTESMSKGLIINIIDSGNGVLTEIRDKIMEPFFTTKQNDVSKGLGLSISKGIIEDHGGYLKYDENNKNTCFIIYLPTKISENNEKVLKS